MTNGRVFASGCLLILTLLPQLSEASFYLRSTNKEFRCQQLGDWLQDIGNASGENLFASTLDLETFRDKARQGFVDPLFSGAFGRGYDDLTKKHRRQIYADLERCHGDTANVADSLRIPFAKRKVLESVEGQQWLEAIYRAKTAWAQPIIARASSSISSNRPFACSTQSLQFAISGAGLDVEPLDPRALDAINKHASRLLRAESARKQHLGRYSQLSRGITNLEYTLGRAESGQMTLVDRDMYIRVIEETLADVRLLFEVPAALDELASYEGALVSWVDTGVRRVVELPDDRALIGQLSQIEAYWLEAYERVCASWRPDLDIPAATMAQLDRTLKAAFERLHSAIAQKLTRLVRTHQQSIETEISGYDTQQQFDAFRFGQLGTGGSLKSVFWDTGVTRHFFEVYDAYQAKLAAEERRKAELAARIELDLLGYELTSPGARGLISGVEPARFFEQYPRSLVTAILGYGVAAGELCLSDGVPGGLTPVSYTSTVNTTDSRTGQVIRSRQTDSRTFFWPSDFYNLLESVTERLDLGMGKLMDRSRQTTYFSDVVGIAGNKGCNSPAMAAYHRNLLTVSSEVDADWQNITGLRALFQSIWGGG